MRKLLSVAAALTLVSSMGCASSVGMLLTEGRDPYIGVKADASLLTAGLYAVPAIIDLPMSAVVDTALLPMTLARARR